MLYSKRFTEGILGSNTYLVWDDASKEAAVIDVGNRPALMSDIISENDLKVKYIILTHAHFDHIYYFPEYREAFKDAVSVLHVSDNGTMGNPRLNASVLFGSERVFDSADMTVNDGDVLYLGKEELRIISTPGHTSGSICILAGKMLFSGDTLFYDGFGRTDLGDGSTQSMAASIEKLYAMDGDITVYPGHGTKTTIDRERRNNPYMDF